jgi:purine-binding chemotaxis protein CheW
MEKKDRERNRSVINPQTLGEVLRAQREEKIEAEEEESLQLLSFMVGREEYALNIMEIKEIIRPKEHTEIPRTPSYILGILSLRGVIIPVYDMRLRMGEDGRSEVTRSSRIVVVRQGENLYGLLVDAVVQVMTMLVRDIEPPPDVISGVDAEFLMGVAKVGERLVILLNLPRLLAVEETLRLEEGEVRTPLVSLPGEGR